jgi:hypothetical protein
MTIDYEFLNFFCEDVLSKDNSIRWVGIINKNGVIIAQHIRQGLKPFLTDEENEQYASTAIARQKTRGRFESKIGKLVYAYGRYEKLHRATIPWNADFYLLLTLDIEEKNFDSIIMDKIVPLLEESKSRFMTMRGNLT